MPGDGEQLQRNPPRQGVAYCLLEEEGPHRSYLLLSGRSAHACEWSRRMAGPLRSVIVVVGPPSRSADFRGGLCYLTVLVITHSLQT
jgi:hypothetical protein